MKQKKRLQFLRYETVWVDSWMSTLDIFVKMWLERRLLAHPYRWVEGGVAVYLPRSR